VPVPAIIPVKELPTGIVVCRVKLPDDEDGVGLGEGAARWISGRPVLSLVQRPSEGSMF
jgi:hypothetical protein